MQLEVTGLQCQKYSLAVYAMFPYHRSYLDEIDDLEYVTVHDRRSDIRDR